MFGAAPSVGDGSARVSSFKAQRACCGGNAMANTSHTCDEGDVEVNCKVRLTAVCLDKALVKAMRR